MNSLAQIEKLYLHFDQDTTDGMPDGPPWVLLSPYEDDASDAVCWFNTDWGYDECTQFAGEIASLYNRSSEFIRAVTEVIEENKFVIFPDTEQSEVVEHIRRQRVAINNLEDKLRNLELGDGG